ncbi:MAG: 3-phosphoshikimate 1-carboxyvinyltransferase [Clostridia bacterium]|nr:3-phosphoshikimate 1-carboxyvinyltransferase [Clostridia bacterium]
MNVVLGPSSLSGEINAIPSKSYAHRIAICNFLAGNEPSAKCGQFSSNDILVTENCLKAMRLGKKVLDCGESGSTLRFLMPLCASLGGEYTFICHGKLIDRPNDELFLAMQAHGVTAEKTDKITLSGKLTSGEYVLRGDISSQYISGLLMALPMLDGDSRITLTTPLSSAPYVDITIEVLNGFGVKIDRTEKGFYVKGNQKFFGEVLPEGDWSNSAFFLVAGAINGEITVKGLNQQSAQGDKYIMEILSRAGAKICVCEKGVTVKKSALKAFSFDAEDCPDLVPISAVLASFAQGESVIRNIQRLKIKESDRVETTIKMLSAFNVKAHTDGENLFVLGGEPVGAEVDSYNDHRIVMSSAVLALGAFGDKSIITNANAVAKSYPTFFNDYNYLGGKANEI